ncbi:urease accessory protein UreF [Marivita hallyeonensis]|uniref:Urease accessory protein UreF n=1 Tax=Marivita hallyeonensis TaxID=996342 RepID=A0A1M5X605_9RHOB|nr:urease accessory UreF family protein [Marivita hallyeonensis]SHH95270.1 urease accessory protein [Marivita hallyeonensis]
MGGPIPTRTDPILTLAQWLSPGFPVGAFAYSSGLEQAIADQLVTPTSLEDWLTDMLQDGTGYVDAILIHVAATSDEVQHVDATARALCPSRERLLEVDALGSAFCQQLRANWGVQIDDVAYPVALGVGVRALSLPIETAVQMYLHAWVSTVVAASQRLMALGQTEAQRIVAALAPLCSDIARQTRESTLDDICSQSFAADIATMRHETLSPRIFRT